MKALPLILLLSMIVSLGTLYGQNNNGKRDVGISGTHLEFGGFGGFSQYYGDISSKNYFEKYALETKPSFGFTGRFHFNEKHGLGLGFNRITHYSAKPQYANGTPLNNEFSGHSNTFFLHSYLNMSNLFWGPAERKLKLYGTLGVGYNSWQSVRRNSANGSVITDYSNAASQNLRSEAFFFPAALGIQFRLTPALSLFAEGMYSTLISDDLDYYRDGYQYDILVQTHLGLSFKLPLSATTPKSTVPEKSSVSTSQKVSSVVPIYVIDYEKFPEMPGERIPPQLPVLEPPKQTSVAPPSQQISSSIEFRVQIYASSRRINNLQNLYRNIKFDSPILENQANGLYRYSTGSFRTYSEAEAYAKQLQSRGINDAFVVAYQNNIRIPISSEMKRK